MTTKEARNICALRIYDPTGVLETMYRRGEMSERDMYEPKRKFRCWLGHYSIEDYLKEGVYNAIIATCERNGRTEHHRGRIAYCDYTAAMNDYIARKACFLADYHVDRIRYNVRYHRHADMSKADDRQWLYDLDHHNMHDYDAHRCLTQDDLRIYHEIPRPRL